MNLRATSSVKTEATQQVKVLATDLDGTLIPLAGNEQNRTDLQRLAELLKSNDVALIFVTGRGIDLVEVAITEEQLPIPNWVICDVGTSIYRRNDVGAFEPLADYVDHLSELIAELPYERLRPLMAGIDGLREQEPHKQGRFKLSYYTDNDRLRDIAIEMKRRLEERAAPYSLIQSVDPFTNDGLIDLLPKGASKAHALNWFTDYSSIDQSSIVFAGDSGNDLAAFISGFQTIIVANAEHSVARQAYDAHRQNGWRNRLFLATQPATSGVVEGGNWYGLFGTSKTDSGTELPIGVTPTSSNSSYFRVWAPKRRRVEVECDDTRFALPTVDDGYFSGTIDGIGPDATYWYVLDGELRRPDPASRYQPDGVHGPSQVVACDQFPWQDDAWRSPPTRDLIIYELHVGTFTEAGTLAAAIERIPYLLDLGVNAVELMPLAQTPGKWNWGYDGVDLFAVEHTYGDPDDLRLFVDTCHRAGIAVILDVVYNHLGPEGNYLGEFGPYFTKRHQTPWGPAFNYDGRQSQPVRDFIVRNAVYWLDEYHIDGLRLDAIHFMFDDSEFAITDEIRAAVSEFAANTGRIIHLIAESNVFNSELHSGTQTNGKGYDASWSDCIMQSLYSTAAADFQLTPRIYEGTRDLAESLEHGFLYSGPEVTRVESGLQPSLADRELRESFVVALQNHDSVGNHPHGKRIHEIASVDFQKVAAALVLLYPSIPLLFMGEEKACSAPFPFFVDFEDEHLRRAVDRGRAKEFPEHSWQGALSPSDPKAFWAAKVGADGNSDMYSWYQSLIRLRREGRAAGWLSAANLTVRCEIDQSLFSLVYGSANGQSVQIYSRLANSNGNCPSIELSVSGQLLLDSKSSSPKLDGKHLVLHANHAVVICDDASSVG